MRAKFAIFLTTAGLLLAIVEPGSAETRRHRPADAYASSAAERTVPQPSDRSLGWSSNSTRLPAKGTAAEPLGPGRNLPYPDRPYGDPDRW